MDPRQGVQMIHATALEDAGPHSDYNLWTRFRSIGRKSIQKRSNQSDRVDPILKTCKITMSLEMDRPRPRR